MRQAVLEKPSRLRRPTLGLHPTSGRMQFEVAVDADGSSTRSVKSGVDGVGTIKQLLDVAGVTEWADLAGARVVALIEGERGDVIGFRSAADPDVRLSLI
ncbi:hypothetical protein [Agromyces humi]|uniref:hypothetical protein n=1 Tax=Agromyces humi TaxID=1766800 RepID=UPI00135B442A|nr:hypothetical protein [Agromyces humi]